MRHSFVGTLQRSAVCFRAAPRARRTVISGRVVHVLAVLAPGQGAQKPGMLTDWLGLPGAESFFRWAGAITDADLLTLGTTGDAEAIKDTAITQPLVVAMSLFLARELGALPEAGGAGRGDGGITGDSGGGRTGGPPPRALTLGGAVAVRPAGRRA